ncbi:MAG TPA: GFA family protein [Polyangiaceae bacterium]|nr:GFA family protein [Polyangiaceae bacterium]
METYEGGCHCGRVRFRVAADLDAVTYCNCSICTKKGILHLIVPPERFELLRGAGELTTYEFNTGTAKHRFCRHCGVQSFYVPRSDPDKIDVNARCLDGVDPSRLTVVAFDGRNWEQAMAGAPAAEPTSRGARGSR